MAIILFSAEPENIEEHKQDPQALQLQDNKPNETTSTAPVVPNLLKEENKTSAAQSNASVVFPAPPVVMTNEKSDIR